MKIELFYDGNWSDLRKVDVDKDAVIEDFGVSDSTGYWLCHGLETVSEFVRLSEVLNELYTEYSYMFSDESELIDAVYVLLKDQHYTAADLVSKNGSELIEYLKERFDEGVWVVSANKTPEKTMGCFMLEQLIEACDDELIESLRPYLTKDVTEDILTIDEFIQYIDLEALGKNVMWGGDYFISDPTPNGNYVIWKP